MTTAGHEVIEDDPTSSFDARQYSVYGLLAAGMRFTDDYDDAEALRHYMELHPEADRAAVEAELKAEIAKHG